MAESPILLFKLYLIFFICSLQNFGSFGQVSKAINEGNSKAIISLQQGNMQHALSLLNDLEQKYNADSILSSANSITFYHLFAQIHKDLLNHELCIEYSHKCLNAIYIQPDYTEYRWNLLFILEYLSHNYHRIGDYYKSLLYSQEGLLQNKLDNNDPVVELLFTNSSALINLNTQNREIALKQLYRCKSLINQLPKSRQFNLAFVLQNTSKIHEQKNNADSSLLYLEQSIAFQEAHPDIFENDFFSLYATAANRYLTYDKKTEAVAYYEKAREHLHQNAPKTEIAYFYEVGSKMDAKNMRYDSAYQNIQKARALLSIEGRQTRTIFPAEFFSLLNTHLDIKKSQLDGQNNVESAQAYHSLAISSLHDAQSVLRNIPSDALKSIIINSTKGIFYHVINSIHILQQQYMIATPPGEIMLIFEAYQAMLVNKEVNKKRWLTKHAIRTDIQSNYERFEHTYDSLMHASYEIAFNTEITSDYQLNSKAIYQLEDSIRMLEDQMKVTYPTYAALMAQQDTLDKLDLDALFLNSKSLLTFFQYENDLFIFHLNDQHNQLIHVDIDDDLAQSIQRWSTTISHGNEYTDNTDSFVVTLKNLHQDGQLIYERLIKPFEKELAHTVLIIPDGDISNIAFSAINRSIPASPTNYVEANYLIEDHKFSTHFSLKLAAQMIRQSNRISKNAYSFVPNQLAMAIPDPLSDDTLHLASLPYSLAEGQLMTQLFGAKLRSRGTTADSLIDEIKNSSLMHIGSHVVLNHNFPEHSYIPFRNDLDEIVTIKPYELFDEPLGIDLVIVNACHSGAGKSSMGRGLLSFVSGFAMADVKSILSSKWAVQDKIGFTLLSKIAHGLKANKSIAASLRVAQLESLHRNDPMASHPSYWASYYIMGDTQVTTSSKNGIFKWIAGAAVLLLIYAGIKYRSKNKFAASIL